MLRTLVLDDNSSLIDSLQILAHRKGLEGTAFFTSLADARREAQQRTFDRYIADQVLEGEEADGLTFLEEVSEQKPHAELVLFTGKPVNQSIETRAQRIGADVVEKASVTIEEIQSLLSEPSETTKSLDSPKETIDIAELRLKIANLGDENYHLRLLNDLLVEDIIEELEHVPNKKSKMLAIGSEAYSPEDLKEEVRKRTPLGRQLIHLHHELFRRLRG